MKQSTLSFQRITCEDRDGRTLRESVLADEVHVWGVALDFDDGELSFAFRYLSQDERERANRLVSAQRRKEFMAAHSALRVILSRYCDQEPQDLTFQKTASEKPFLPHCTADSELIAFNLTHSHGRAVVAIAKGREVGVDLEKVRSDIAVESLAKRFLSKEDQAWIEGGEPSQRHERFLQVWVAREAVSKAEGTGMTFPLNRDYVDFSFGQQHGRVIRRHNSRRNSELLFRLLPLEPGWVGAVAANGTDWRVVVCA